MKTYNQIHFSQISEILMQAALGVSAVCDYNITIMFTQNRDYTKMEQEFDLL